MKRSLFLLACVLAGLCSPSWAASLPIGQTQTGVISATAQSNTYTLAAVADDVVSFTMVATSGRLVPKLQIYNPNGTRLNGNYSGSPWGCSGSTLELNNVALKSTGVYTVLVSDCGDVNTGDYTIYSQLTNRPAGAAYLSFGGQPQSDTIEAVAQSKTYVLSANAKDVVNFTLVVTSGKMVPRLRLYSPDGAQLSSSYSGSPWGCSGSSLELNTVAFSVTGTYAVRVGDCGDTNNGTYLLYAQRTNNPAEPAALLFGGQPQTGSIGSAAASNAYVFSGVAKDFLNLTIVTTSGGLIPRLQIYSPNGTLLSSAYSGAPWGCSGGTLELNSVGLPESGAYTILVSDCGATKSGTYNLSAQCLGACSSIAPSSHKLTLQASPTTAGVVMATPSSPTGMYPNGSRVCLTASASSGWLFRGWTGAALDSSGCLVMDTDRSVMATFVAVTANPSIQITAISPFGELPGSVTGIVSGVTPSDYRIAPLLFLTGQGWYSKPFCDANTVALGQDGMFSIVFTTGGVDQYATKIALFLIPTSVSVQCHSSAAGIPSDLLQKASAQLIINRPNPKEREIPFSGHLWGVKASTVPIGPGGCVFSDSSDNVTVDDQGRLHLRIYNREGTWSCAEVYSRAAVGYGTYSWTIEAVPTLAPTVVLGAFTWADGEPTAREIDTEIGFSGPGDSTNAQFVVQPFSQAGNLRRISLPPSVPIIFRMTWLPDSLSFQALSGSGDKLADWTFGGTVPPADRAYENFRFNLWMNGGPPASGQAQEAVIRSFQYQPFVSDTAVPSLFSIVNAASFATGVSPGANFTVFGRNLAKQPQSATGGPLPTTLSDVVGLINGIPAPLFYVGPNQINGQIPYTAPIGPSQLSISVGGTTTQLLPFANAPAAPGIFPGLAQNCLVQNQDGHLNGPGAPADAGSVITAYLTGLGQVDNPVPSGAAAPSFPLSRPVLPGTAQFDGEPVTVEFLGLSPGQVGIGQSNIRVPSNVPSGQRQLTVTIGGVVSNSCAVSVLNATAPVITGVTPAAAAAGGGAVTLTVTGTGFVNGSAVQWNGSPLATNYLGATQLSALIPAALVAHAGSASITVVNPGNVSSGGVTFLITSVAPVISSISPASAGAGGPPLTLTVNGAGFMPGSIVQWGGSPLSTTFVSATELQAAVPAALLANAAEANITVVNPGNVSSNVVTFSIASSTPVISGVTPASTTAGAPTFTLVVTGTGFVTGSTVRWNGSALVTTFVSGTQLRATVPATLLINGGTSVVTVVNPGGAFSNAMTFVISQPGPSPTITATIQACAVKGTVGNASPISAYRVVVYALTNQYYLQSCDTDRPWSIGSNGTWGPVESHSGAIYALLVRDGYAPAAVLSSLPPVDGVNVFARSASAGVLSGCDVARCPAR